MDKILSILFPVRMPRIERIYLQNGQEHEIAACSLADKCEEGV